jgi:hypothetical protein
VRQGVQPLRHATREAAAEDAVSDAAYGRHGENPGKTKFVTRNSKLVIRKSTFEGERRTGSAIRAGTKPGATTILRRRNCKFEISDFKWEEGQLKPAPTTAGPCGAKA